MQTVLVTGSRGFIGKNLLAHLAEMNEVRVLAAHWDASEEEWQSLIAQADKIVHLAGVNRPDATEDFELGNSVLTKNLCHYAMKTNRRLKGMNAEDIANLPMLTDERISKGQRMLETMLTSTYLGQDITMYPLV